jgi:hypothetical protein
MQEQEKEVITNDQLHIKKESSPFLIVPDDDPKKWLQANHLYPIINKLDSLLEIVQDQQQELSELRVEVG